MIQISAVTEAHYPIIQAMAERTWQVAYAQILSPEQMRYMLDMMYSTDAIHSQVHIKAHRFIIGMQGGEPQGFASYETNYKGNRKTRIHKLYVLPQQQGSGLGRRLVDYITQAALDAGDHALELNVNRFNKAVGFYKKTGFIITGEEDIDIGRGYLMEDYIMEKELQPGG